MKCDRDDECQQADQQLVRDISQPVHWPHEGDTMFDQFSFTSHDGQLFFVAAI